MHRSHLRDIYFIRLGTLHKNCINCISISLCVKKSLSFLLLLLCFIFYLFFAFLCFCVWLLCVLLLSLFSYKNKQKEMMT